MLHRQRFSQKLHGAICRCDVSLRHVAATCRLVCTDHYNHLRSAIWPGDEVEPETFFSTYLVPHFTDLLVCVK